MVIFLIDIQKMKWWETVSNTSCIIEQNDKTKPKPEEIFMTLLTGRDNRKCFEACCQMIYKAHAQKVSILYLLNALLEKKQDFLSSWIFAEWNKLVGVKTGRKCRHQPNLKNSESKFCDSQTPQDSGGCGQIAGA